MSPAIRAVLCVATVAAGILAGEVIARAPFCHEFAGRIFGRGKLLAIASGTGIYRDDLVRRSDAIAHLSGLAHLPDGRRAEILADLVAEQNLRHASRDESASEGEVAAQLDLLEDQFANDQRWNEMLARCGFTIDELRAKIRDDLRGEKWLEGKIIPALRVTDEACQNYYDNHREQFEQPEHFRASQLFLAAPDQSPPDLVEAKRTAIASFATRIAHGESLAIMAPNVSEDDGSKSRGGDLNYFSSARMPPEFFAAVSRLSLNQTSAPIQSHLGFHIVTIADVKPERLMTFAEALPEIRLRLANEQRRRAVSALRAQMAQQAAFRAM